MRTPKALKLAAGGAAGVAIGMLFSTVAHADEEGLEAAAAVQATLDNVWILVAAVLVIFMQAGFALVEAGLTRAKNVANIFMKNLMDFCVGALLFFAVGYAIAYGGDFTGAGKFIGGDGWFLAGDGVFTYGNLDKFTFFTFQVAFAATAATIVSGAMAERTKFSAYVIYSAVISAVIYPIVVRWQWGGGWLFQGGINDTPFHDFAGSSIVHMVGGVRPPWAPRSSGHASASTDPTASRASSPATASRSRSSAASSCWSAGTASTPAHGWARIQSSA